MGIPVRPDGTIMGRPDGEVAAIILPPCQRDGAPDDWWGKQHKDCTGSHHVGPGKYVRCACTCHPPLITEAEYCATVSAIRPWKAERCDCGEPCCQGWRCVRLNVGVCECGHLDEQHRGRYDGIGPVRCEFCDCPDYRQVRVIAEHRPWETK